MLPLRGLHRAFPFLDLHEILSNFFDLLVTRSDGQFIVQDFGEQLNSTLSSNWYPAYLRGSPHSLNIGGISSVSSSVVSATKIKYYSCNLICIANLYHTVFSEDSKILFRTDQCYIEPLLSLDMHHYHKILDIFSWDRYRHIHNLRHHWECDLLDYHNYKMLVQSYRNVRVVDHWVRKSWFYHNSPYLKIKVIYSSLITSFTYFISFFAFLSFFFSFFILMGLFFFPAPRLSRLSVSGYEQVTARTFGNIPFEHESWQIPWTESQL